MSKKPLKWDSNFELITESIRVSGDDSALMDDDEYEVIRCQCKDTDNGPCCLNEACLNFATQIECMKCVKNCGNNRILKKKYKSVEVREAGGKGFGLFAQEDIKKRDLVVEYFGEIISDQDLMDRFAKLDGRKSERHLYIMQLKKKTFVDARYKGGVARFLNHCCEPNCRLEIWSVKDRLRLAVFAIRDISAEDELTLDYQWEPSDRPPTVCLCGAPSCRGYIEMASSPKKKKKNDFLDGRTGNWVSCREKEMIAQQRVMNSTTAATEDAVFDEKGQIISQNLIGKFVKLWNEEKQTFHEMKVEDYNESEDSFECYDFFKKASVPVNLNDPQLLWYYLDETAEPSAIKRKSTVDEHDDESDSSDNESSNSRKSSEGKEKDLSNLVPTTQTLKKLERTSLKIKLAVALEFVVSHRQIKNDRDEYSTLTDDPPTPSDPAEEPLDTSNCKSVLKRFAGVASKNYGIRAVFHFKDDDNEFKDGKASHVDMELIGDVDSLQLCRHKLRDIYEQIKAKEQAQLKKERDELIARQSSTVLHDWRMIPQAPSSSQQGGNQRAYLFCFNQLHPAIAEINRLLAANHSWIDEKHISRLSFHGSSSAASSSSQKQHLFSASNLLDNHVYYELSKSMEQNLFHHLQQIMRERLSYSAELTFHSLVLLSRYLLLLNDSAIKDSIIILSAIILLTLKSYNLVIKPSLMKKICYLTYSQVYQRATNSSTDNKEENYASILHLLPKLQEKEAEIYLLLNKDCYFPNVFMIFMKNYYCYLRETQAMIVTETEKEVMTSLLQESLGLSEHLLGQYYGVVMALPTELFLSTNLLICYALLSLQRKITEETLPLKQILDLLSAFQLTPEMVSLAAKFLIDLMSDAQANAKSSSYSSPLFAEFYKSSSSSHGSSSYNDNGSRGINNLTTAGNQPKNLLPLLDCVKKLVANLENLNQFNAHSDKGTIASTLDRPSI